MGPDLDQVYQSIFTSTFGMDKYGFNIMLYADIKCS